MSKLDDLYNVLKEQLQLYESFLKIEEEKYNVILIDDIKKLDEIVSEEQVFFLKSRGLDQRREKILGELGFSGKTLKEVINNIEPIEKDRFTKMHADIFSVLAAFKDKNNQCQDLVQIRLHRAQQMISKLDESKNINKQYFKDGSTDEIDVKKMNFISKRI